MMYFCMDILRSANFFENSHASSPPCTSNCFQENTCTANKSGILVNCEVELVIINNYNAGIYIAIYP